MSGSVAYPVTKIEVWNTAFDWDGDGVGEVNHIHIRLNGAYLAGDTSAYVTAYGQPNTILLPPILVYIDGRIVTPLAAQWGPFVLPNDGIRLIFEEPLAPNPISNIAILVPDGFFYKIDGTPTEGGHTANFTVDDWDTIFTTFSSISAVLRSIAEHLTLTGTDNISGTGNALANRIAGNSGNNSLSGEGGSDTLSGSDGNDTLDGGSGADSLSGGNGNDVFFLDDPGDLLSDTGGADTVIASFTVSLSSFAETLVLAAGAVNGTGNGFNNHIFGNSDDNTLNGAGGSDTLDGGEGADTLQGASGNDVLFGGAGGDRLWGGPGADTMFGGLGNDIYHIDNAGDVVSEVGGDGVDLLFSLVSVALPTGFENLTLTGGDSITGTGNALGNVITGNNAANLLAGGGGADSLAGDNGHDTLTGGAGADTMAGQIGNDRYVVDTVFDVLIELPGEGNDIVTSAVSWTLGANFESLTLTGALNVSGTGNALANRIAGNAGNNLLNGLEGNDNLMGGDGADTLIGGLGRDALTGGGGADRFVLNDTAAGLDRIADFVSGEDVIAADSLGFGGLPLGALDSAHFVAHGSSLATAPFGTAQFVYNTTTGDLLFDRDGLGGVNAIRIAVLTGSPTLTAGDIVIA